MAVREKEFVTRHWKTDFFAPIAEAESLDIDTQAAIRTELAKEVCWFIDRDNPEPLINIRLNKIQALVSASETGSIVNFDPFWEYRFQFLNWLLLP